MFEMIHDKGGGYYEDGWMDGSDSTQSGMYTQSDTYNYSGTETSTWATV